MNEKIENLLKEERKFPPSKQLTENANATSSWYEDADKNRLEFWQKQALTRISWFKEPTEVLDALATGVSKNPNANICSIHFFPLGGSKTNADWISNNLTKNIKSA